DDLQPNKKIKIIVKNDDLISKEFYATAKLDSPIEVEYFRNGGILQYVLRSFLKKDDENFN
ncbi:MAG TPA: hypothetical protein VLB84_14300, partial [Bacteroidia bacterium]|nr:hypothetical protein [Bacteroidia bacterium]